MTAPENPLYSPLVQPLFMTKAICDELCIDADDTRIVVTVKNKEYLEAMGYPVGEILLADVFRDTQEALDAATATPALAICTAWAPEDKL